MANELRRLKFGDRPVTGEESSRERIQQALSIRSRANETSIEQPNSVSYRSELVQSELADLSNRQSVSTILRESGERIEQTLQHILQNRSARSQVAAPQSSESRRTNAEPSNDDLQLFNAIRDYSRNQVLSEIGELVQRQLVSSTLESEFRRDLENNVLSHLRRIGTDETVTDNLTRLVNSNEILAQQTNSRQRHRQTTSREIDQLKSELGELKSLMKLSFELQMDMQRAFKQEISALVNNTFNKTESARLVQLNTIENRTEGQCIICAEATADTVFYKCGHMCACFKCSMDLKQQELNCAVCRAPIVDIIKTYKCNFAE